MTDTFFLYYFINHLIFKKMKKSMNFYAPISLLVLGLAFGLFSCHTDTPEGEPCYEEPNPLYFAITDLSFNNLSPTKEDSYYDLDYVHIIMHDGKKVEDLKYVYAGQQFDTFFSANKGYIFVSDFLGDIASSEEQSCKHIPNENTINYMNRPFYLHLSIDDIDTLMWKQDGLYHNGQKAPVDKKTPFIIRKKAD